MFVGNGDEFDIGIRAAAGVKKSGALVAKLIAMLEVIIPPRIFMAFGAEL